MFGVCDRWQCLVKAVSCAFPVVGSSLSTGPHSLLPAATVRRVPFYHTPPPTHNSTNLPQINHLQTLNNYTTFTCMINQHSSQSHPILWPLLLFMNSPFSVEWLSPLLRVTSKFAIISYSLSMWVSDIRVSPIYYVMCNHHNMGSLRHVDFKSRCQTLILTFMKMVIHSTSKTIQDV